MSEDRVTLDRDISEEQCEVGRTGHCSLHGIEIERRKNTQEDVKELKQDHIDLKSDIGILLAFKNGIQGGLKWGGILLTIIMLGSYTYIYNHIQDAEREYDRIQHREEMLHTELAEVKAIQNSLKIDQGRSDERASAINARLSSIDGRLAQMIGLMMQSGKLNSDDVMEMYKNGGAN